MTAPIDYNAVLADLQARRTQAVAQFDAAIAVIQTMLGSSASGDETPASPMAGVLAQMIVSPSPASQSASSEIRSDMYFGLSTAGAVRKYLTINKRPASPKVIAQALMDGGQIHAVDEKTAYTNVYSVLKRLKDKDFSQTRNGDWGLKDWYPNKPKGEE